MAKRAPADVASGSTSSKRKSPRAKKKQQRRGTFATRDRAVRFAQDALDETKQSLKAQLRMLQQELTTVNKEIKACTPKGSAPPTALIEARTSILVGLKSLQAAQTKFVMDLSKNNNLLSHLDPPKDTGEKLVINFVLPDLGKIPVVTVAHRPSAAITGEKTDDDSDDATAEDDES